MLFRRSPAAPARLARLVERAQAQEVTSAASSDTVARLRMIRREEARNGADFAAGRKGF